MADNPSKYKRINKDLLREMLDNSSWSRTNENFVLEIRGAIMYKALRDGKSVIVDDTNLDPQHEPNLRTIAEKMDAEFIVQDFTDVPLKDCILRDIQRPKSVGRDVIVQMYNRYLKPVIQPVQQNPDLPDAYQYDLDGTLALFDNPNNIKSLNYDREFQYDKLNYPVFDQLIMQQRAGYKIIICSGRNGEFEEVTKEWLGKNGIHPDLFIMRAVGDRRKDFEIKEEMFREHILPNYFVNAIYDDRDQVVNLWRNMGLTCFQVAEGDF